MDLVRHMGLFMGVISHPRLAFLWHLLKVSTMVSGSCSKNIGLFSFYCWDAQAGLTPQCQNHCCSM